jgi:hypothetical protein
MDRIDIWELVISTKILTCENYTFWSKPKIFVSE